MEASFVANKQLADQLAEVGVMLLMFGVGLHFHLKDLIAVRGVAIGAICQSTVATVLGALTARLFGWDWSARHCLWACPLVSSKQSDRAFLRCGR